MKKNLPLWLSGAAVLAMSFFSATLSKAQSYVNKDSVHVNPVIYANIGGYFPTITTSLRVDSDLGFGTDISLEDDFRMPAQLSVFKADVFWRVKNRTQFVFSFTSLKRDKELKLEKDISFADTTFHLDSEVKAYFNTNYYCFNWRYSVWNHPGWNAGFSVGLRALQIDAGISARVNNQSYSRDKQIIAPAMLLGIHGSGYLTDKLLARYSMDYFQLSVEDIKIVVVENRFTLEYFFIKNAGVGAGYATSVYNVKEIPFDDEFKGRVRYGFAGFQAFLTARF